MTSQLISPEKAQQYWHKTRQWMFFLLFLWLVFSFAIHLFARDLNAITVLGFPLGFYMAAQGSLIAFVFLCFWNAARQDGIDEEFGVTED